MLFLTALLAVVLIGFDGYISYRRIKQYGSFAEVNLLVRQVIQDYGLPAGTTIGAAYNLGILWALVHFQLIWALTFFTGVKFGLALMQLKSMQMETFVEKVLVKARARKGIK